MIPKSDFITHCLVIVFVVYGTIQVRWLQMLSNPILCSSMPSSSNTVRRRGSRQTLLSYKPSMVIPAAVLFIILGGLNQTESLSKKLIRF